MKLDTKSAAMMIFAALIGSANAASVTRSDVSSKELDPKMVELFEKLWQEGVIKLDSRNGELILDQNFVESLVKTGLIKKEQMAGGGDITAGGCY